MHFAVSFSMTFFLFLSSLSATIYDQSTYSKNYFYDTEFEEIVRFDPLEFHSDTLSEESEEYLKEIAQKIQTYTDAKKKIIITIVGHTSLTTDNANEKKLESRSYAKKIQNYFSTSFDADESFERSRNYAFKIQKYLKAKGIDKNITMLELRSDKDGLFSVETEDGNELSNRVMVSMYVEKDLDADRDGVLKADDNCPNSKPDAKVDENGCSYRTIVLLLKAAKKNSAIMISTNAGNSIIEHANDYTLLKSKNSMVKVLNKMSDEEMKLLFGDVLVDANLELVKFTLYFNDIDLLKDSESKLPNIIDIISKSKDAYIQVIGHTDTRGEKVSNEILAKKRADLVSQKIKSATNSYFYFVTESYGENNLAVQTDDEVSEPLNKRVEILIR